MTKTCLLLVNTGSPDSPSVKDVRTFLSLFLNDKNVIDLPWLWRKILVNGIIIPFRTHQSAKNYGQLWKIAGASPLLKYSENLQQKLNSRLPENTEAEIAMLYGKPFLQNVLRTLKEKQTEKIILFPMYPQYASSTVGAVIERMNKILKKINYSPEIQTIKPFFDQPAWINAVIKNVKKFRVQEYGHILFSYHSLPIRQIEKQHPQKNCKNCLCEKQFDENDRNCYKAACYQTTRLLAEKLQLPKTKFTTCFQSHMGKKWLSPFTDTSIVDLAQKDCKKLLIFSPSFTTDCLETLIEIGVKYKTLFKTRGGKQLDLVPCPNNSEIWVKGIVDWVKSLYN